MYVHTHIDIYYMNCVSHRIKMNIANASCIKVQHKNLYANDYSMLNGKTQKYDFIKCIIVSLTGAMTYMGSFYLLITVNASNPVQIFNILDIYHSVHDN